MGLVWKLMPDGGFNQGFYIPGVCSVPNTLDNFGYGPTALRKRNMASTLL